jgi:hypothetical protein
VLGVTAFAMTKESEDKKEQRAREGAQATQITRPSSPRTIDMALCGSIVAINQPTIRRLQASSTARREVTAVRSAMN